MKGKCRYGTDTLGALAGGGGAFSLEKGTDCGPSATELGLSRANIAKKGGCSAIINADRESSNLYVLGFYIKQQMHPFKVVLRTNNLVKSNPMNSSKSDYLKGHLLSHYSGDSTDRRITSMRGIKLPICWTLKKYLVGSNDLLSLPINIDNLSIVLCSLIRH